ncbi:MAG: phage tail protein, partial [Dongiaceae bacterium]
AAGANGAATVRAEGVTMRIYPGAADQLPDPAIQADRGIDFASAWRDFSYIVFLDVPLANTGNALPQEVSVVYVKDGTLVYLNVDLTATAPGPIGADSAFQSSSFDPVGPYIWNGWAGGNITKFNTVSRTYELQRDVEEAGVDIFAGAPVADEFGNVYAPSIEPGVAFHRFDAETLAHTGDAAIIVGSLAPSYMTYRSFVSGSQRWLAGMDSLGGLHVYSPDLLAQLAPRLALGTNAGNICDVSEGGIFWAPWHDGSTSKVRKVILTATPLATLPFAAVLAADFDVTATHGAGLSLLHYYADEGVLLLSGGGALSKMNPDNGGIVASMAGAGSGEYIEWRKGPTDGRIWNKLSGANGAFIEIDIASLTILRSVTPTSWAGSGGTKEGAGYDKWSDALIAVVASNDGLRQLFLPRLDPLSVDLADIIADVSARVGLTAADIDVSGVTDTVRGYTVRRPTSARAILEPLLVTHSIDAIEVDGKIKFVPRGQAAVLTVSSDDLGARLVGAGGDEGSSELAARPLPHPRDLPERLVLKHVDPDSNYEPGLQPAKRPREAVVGHGEQTIETSEVLTVDEAARIAEKLLYGAHIEVPVEIALPRKYGKLAVADVVTLPVAGRTYQARLTEIDEGPFLRLKAMLQDTASYSSSASGHASTIPGQVVQLTAETQMFLIDSALIRDQDDDAGFYLGGARSLSAALWSGAEIFKSNDGVTFAPWFSFDEEIEWGIAVNALADKPAALTDRTSTLTIQMRNGALAGITEDEMRANNGNAILAQSGADWELMLFADAVDLGDKRYDISTMLRGRRGTEQQTTGHQAGDKIIVLSAATLHRLVAASEIGLARYYKATSFGKAFNPAGAIPFTNRARGLMPYAPSYIRGTRDGS